MYTTCNVLLVAQMILMVHKYSYIYECSNVININEPYFKDYFLSGCDLLTSEEQLI